MAYFVTGATGFIGQFLVANLLKRGEPDLRARAQELAEEARRRCASDWGADEKQVIAVVGDLGEEEPRRRRRRPATKLKGKVDALLPPRRDLRPQRRAPRQQQVANVEGTRHAVQFAEAVGAGCFHHVSSIAAAGLYDGVFREDMFEEAEDLDHPYFRTKHDSEGIVRRECKRPFRIYRPGLRRRPLEDRLHRQDRRALLLLQVPAEDAQRCCRRGCR